MSTEARMAVNIFAGMALYFVMEIGVTLILQGNLWSIVLFVYPALLTYGFIGKNYPWGRFLDKTVGGYDD